MNTEELIRIEAKEHCGHGDDSTVLGIHRSPGASRHLVIHSMHQARDIVMQRQRAWQDKTQRVNTGFAYKVLFSMLFELWELLISYPTKVLMYFYFAEAEIM